MFISVLFLLTSQTGILHFRFFFSSSIFIPLSFWSAAVRAIGRCAIKLGGAAEKCINVLLELIQTKVNFVVQEAIVVIKDIFRKYPNR